MALRVDAQNRLSEPYLAGLPGRDIFRQRLTALYDHERLSTPEKRGSRYFFTRNTGLQARPALYVREGSEGPERVVIDLNGWSEGGTSALAEWAPSQDGTHLAFTVQENNADFGHNRLRSRSDPPGWALRLAD